MYSQTDIKGLENRQIERDISKGGSTQEKLEKAKSNIKKVKKQSDRDYIGNRQKEHDWDAISKSVSQKGTV